MALASQMTVADTTEAQRNAAGIGNIAARASYKKHILDRDMEEFWRQSKENARRKLQGDTVSAILTGASLAAGGSGLLASAPSGATAAEKAASLATSMNRGAGLAGSLSQMVGSKDMAAIGQLGKAGMESYANRLPVPAETAPALSENPSPGEIDAWLKGGGE